MNVAMKLLESQIANLHSFIEKPQCEIYNVDYSLFVLQQGDPASHPPAGSRHELYRAHTDLHFSRVRWLFNNLGPVTSTYIGQNV